MKRCLCYMSLYNYQRILRMYIISCVQGRRISFVKEIERLPFVNVRFTIVYTTAAVAMVLLSYPGKTLLAEKIIVNCTRSVSSIRERLTASFSEKSEASEMLFDGMRSEPKALGI